MSTITWVDNSKTNMNYYELEPEDNIFPTLGVDITHRCNMKCSNCYIPNRYIPDMDIEKFENFLSRLPGRVNLRLVGAESTLHKDLFEFIRLIRKYGHRAYLTSNGLKFDDIEYVKELRKTGIKIVGISLNGVANDDIYEIMDSSRCAKRKLEGLRNLMKCGFAINTNTILAPGVNENSPKEMVELVTNMAEEVGYKFRKVRPFVLRFKSIGNIGRYMEGYNMRLDDIMVLFKDQLGIDPDKVSNVVEGMVEEGCVVFQHETRMGNLLFKVTDWSVDENGVADPGNLRRGRITQDFKCAPFFEHVKLNEGGY